MAHPLARRRTNTRRSATVLIPQLPLEPMDLVLAHQEISSHHKGNFLVREHRPRNRSPSALSCHDMSGSMKRQAGNREFQRAQASDGLTMRERAWHLEEAVKLYNQALQGATVAG